MSDPVADALNRLTAVLQGQLQVTTLDGARGRNVFVPFQGAIGNSGGGGSTTVTIWTPESGKRYVLRGFAITAVVRTLLAAASAHALYFHDSSSTTAIIAPIGSYGPTDAVGTILTGTAGPLVCNLHEGVRGTAVGTSLKLTSGNDLSTGIIRFTGVVWGVLEDN
jgi:hypothetical protein